MPKKLTLAASAAVLLLAAAPALADGDLHIYNWGDYTNPKLIEKFEKAYNVKVTLDDYDSNETMLSKVRTGNTGYDIVVPSDYTVKIMIADGLLEKTEPNQMPPTISATIITVQMAMTNRVLRALRSCALPRKS